MPKARAPRNSPQAPAKPRRQGSDETFLGPTTVSDILGVVLCVVAVAMMVAILSPTSAPVTSACAEALAVCFGVGAFLVPVAVLLLALTFFVPSDAPLSARASVGLGLVVLAILALISLSVPGAAADPGLVLREEVAMGTGGWVGGGVAWCLLASVGHDVGIVVLVGVIVLGLVVCGLSITGLAVKIRQARNSALQRLEERRQRDAGDTLRRGEADALGRARKTRTLDDEAARETSFIGARKTSVLTRRPERAPEPVVAEADAPLRPVAPEPAPIPYRPPAGLRPLPVPSARPMPRLRPAVAAFDGSAALDVVGESPVELAPEPELEAEAEAAPLPDFLLHFGEEPSRAAEAEADADPDAAGEAEPVAAPAPARRSGRPARRRATRRSAAGSSARPAAVVREDSVEAFQAALDAEVAARSRSRRPSPTPASAPAREGLPPLSMLSSNPESAFASADRAELEATAARLQATLEEFGLRSRVVGWVSGPLVTTFKIEMGEGERVNKITNLEDDIALTLAAESVRIFAPIPGTSQVGIEIPNRARQNVHLGDVLPHAEGGPLELAIGRDAEGNPVVEDLATMPHLLIAGATGSGKSVMINSIIMSLIMRSTPEELRLILIDPKRVELGGYNGLPHLYVPVVTEPKKASGALAWAVGEMDRRLKLFEKAGARDIGVYNRQARRAREAGDPDAPEPIPYLVLIVDELSDLMMVAGKDVEASIVRIAQLARAAGIHLIVATQRPSANVVTGLIKSNIENRIAFSVASGIDSRVILDQVGAERLLGRGDMLLRRSGKRTRRVLGAYVSDEEINAVVDFIKEHGDTDYHDEVLAAAPTAGPEGGQTPEEGDDPLVWEAARLVVKTKLGSTSGLQRRLKVGYARAGRIMDMLEAKGVVGPPDGSKPRDVLLDEASLEDLIAADARYSEV